MPANPPPARSLREKLVALQADDAFAIVGQRLSLQLAAQQVVTEAIAELDRLTAENAELRGLLDECAPLTERARGELAKLRSRQPQPKADGECAASVRLDGETHVIDPVTPRPGAKEDG